MPANPGSLTERKIFPMFSRWKTARTPRMAWAAAVSSLTTRPLAIVASTGTAYSIPGKWKSEVYFAVPVTLAGPSTRGVLRPIGDVVVAIFDPPVESACRRHLEGVGETAPGELDFERVLALGFCVAERRLGRLSEGRVVRRLTHEHRFGLGSPPRLRADTAQRDARARHLARRAREHDGRRRQGELVRRPVAKLQVHLTTSRDGRRQRHVRDEIAGLEHGLTLWCIAGQKMEVADRYRTRAVLPLHVDRRFQCRQPHAHVRRIGRDAVLARPEDGECPVAPADRGAACPGLPLVACHGGVAEVHAPRALEQVARRRGHVAELCRGAREKGLG